MKGKCYNCDYEGEYEWYWLITDSQDESIGHATHSMSSSEAEMGDTHTECYYCPKCGAED